MKVMERDYNAKLDTENIFKLRLWNESLHEMSSDMWHENSDIVTYVNTFKILLQDDTQAY